MRLNEIARLDEEELTNENIVELIRRDCQPFIQSGAEAIPLRGMKGKPDDRPIRMSVRKDRRPYSMGRQMHARIDAWFDERFGFKARSQCVFVAGDYSLAQNYGEVYGIFPIGEFKFAWSPKVDDLYGHVYDPDSDMLNRNKSVEDQLEDHEYRDTNLKRAIASDNEIMILCDAYYAVPLASPRVEREMAKKVFEK